MARALTKSASESFASAIALSLAANGASASPDLSVNPHAPSCPPKRSRYSLASDRAWVMLNPGMERPEPTKPFSDLVTTSEGRQNCSVILPLTKPTTPTGQSSPSATSTFAGSWFLTCSLASLVMRTVWAWRSLLVSFRDWANDAPRDASLVSKSSYAVFAWSILPAALSLGAIMNPISYARKARGSIWLPEMSDCKPGLLVLASTLSPKAVNTRFSPLSSTMSATVAIATTSKNHFSWPSGSLNDDHKAWHNLNTTPHAAKPLNGYVSPERCGFKNAVTSCGSSAGSSWWSQMMTSMPLERAYATSATDDVPQSTVMMSCAVCSAM